MLERIREPWMLSVWIVGVWHEFWMFSGFYVCSKEARWQSNTSWFSKTNRILWYFKYLLMQIHRCLRLLCKILCLLLGHYWLIFTWKTLLFFFFSLWEVPAFDVLLLQYCINFLQDTCGVFFLLKHPTYNFKLKINTSYLLAVLSFQTGSS